MTWNNVRTGLVTLNLFENVDKPHPPEEELRVQRGWTRTYLVALILILVVLVFFTSLTYEINTITVSQPTLEFYRDFQQPIDCPCTNSTILYGIFVNLTPSFHDICSSDFIAPFSDWTLMLYKAFVPDYLSEEDTTTFESTALLHFLALQVMCEAATQTVHNELVLFLNSTLVSTQMIEFGLFQKQINATLSDLRSISMPSKFLYSLQLIRGMYSGSSFIPAFGTSWSPYILDEVSNALVAMQAQEYNHSSCNCATSPACVQTMKLKLGSGSLWSVPGMLLGCIPLESMLQSTLECMYDQTCLDLISRTLLTSSIYPALAANRTRFHPINTTRLDAITSDLFIEQWFVNVSFEAYFKACQPNTCSYSLSKRFNFLNVINMLLAVYGGLTIVLKLAVPIAFNFSYKYLLKRNRRVASINTP